MKKDAAISVLDGNIQAIGQGIALIESLSDEQYCYVASPYVKSTIGQHFRHIVDMFRAVISESSCVDYDSRRRGADIERMRSVAIAELLDVQRWMLNRLNDSSCTQELYEEVLVRSEVTVDDTRSVDVVSSRLRELVFASSHAIHHYALISVIAKIQGVTLDENLGVAPATASFLRQEVERKDDSFSCAL